jgi:uncharacterized membrane protein YkoI
MKTNTLMTAAALMLVAGMSAQAQDTTRTAQGSGIKIRKDAPSTMSHGTMPGAHAAMSHTMTDSAHAATLPEWYRATTCPSYDTTAVRSVAIKSDLYSAGAGMISPDSAKAIAVCAVPGQVTSGEMEQTDGRTTYAVTVIPNQKKTHSKVVIDAQTGAVLSSKQFGGLRGVAGWVRESMEHKENKKP